MAGYVAADLYWGRCDRELVDRSLLGTEWYGMVLYSLLGTMLKRMTLYISTWEGVVAYDAVYTYWGSFGREWVESLLGTVW